MAVENTAEMYSTYNTTLAVKSTFEVLQGFLGGILSGSESQNENRHSVREALVQINNQVKRLQKLKSEGLST